MKSIGTIALVSVITVGVSACNTSADKSVLSLDGHGTAGQDRVLVQNFKRQGIRIESSPLGDIKAIEVTGFASVWETHNPRLSLHIKWLSLMRKRDSLISYIAKQSLPERALKCSRNFWSVGARLT